MENWNWKPTVHFRITEQAAPLRQSPLFAFTPEPRTEPPCDHVNAPRLSGQQRFDGGQDTLCGACGAVVESSPADPNVCTIIDAGGDPFDDGIYAGTRYGLTKPTVHQHVPFTDYPTTAPAKFYVRDNVLMLPEEY